MGTGQTREACRARNVSCSLTRASLLLTACSPGERMCGRYGLRGVGDRGGVGGGRRGALAQLMLALWLGRAKLKLTGAVSKSCGGGGDVGGWQCCKHDDASSRAGG